MTGISRNCSEELARKNELRRRRIAGHARNVARKTRREFWIPWGGRDVRCRRDFSVQGNVIIRNQEKWGPPARIMARVMLHAARATSLSYRSSCDVLFRVAARIFVRRPPEILPRPD